jgi:hypothetical protein
VKSNSPWLSAIQKKMELPTTELESKLIGTELPKRLFESQNCGYGAQSVAAHYCGFEEPPLVMSGEWQHGWHPPQHNIHPELVVGTTGSSRDWRDKIPFWVARKDQEEYLRAHGYVRAGAIGLPLVYLPKVEVQREVGSLLVMPVHSLSYTKHSWDFDRYADEIASVAGRFSRVAVCVYPACFQKNYWVTSFRDRGLPVVSGAQYTDPNSLLRIATLFSRFEFVTSNGFGSQLAFAAYLGAKPSIYGTLATYTAEDFSEDLFYRQCPGLLPRGLELVGETHLRKTYPEFFCDPWTARSCEKWGAWQLGAEWKRPPAELRRLFRWTIKKRVSRGLKNLARKTPLWGAAKAFRNRLFKKSSLVTD